jgi:hypothetical protein
LWADVAGNSGPSGRRQTTATAELAEVYRTELGGFTEETGELIEAL